MVRTRRAAVAAVAAFAVLTSGAVSAAVSLGPGTATAARQPGGYAMARTHGVRAGLGVPAAKPIGDPRGIALLARVHRAYIRARARGVELSVIPRRSTFPFPRRFVLLLRRGTLAAEEFRRPGPRGITLVARRGGPTYARDAGATCWRRLTPSNPRTLVDVGIKFPYSRRPMKVMPPQATSFGWRLKSENPGRYWFLATQRRHVPSDKAFVNYAIGAKSHLIRSIFVQIVEPTRPQKKWPAATLKAKTLTTAPHLPVPAPVC